MHMQNPISRWHDVVNLRDYNALTEILDEHVIFYSPVVYTPQRGKDITLKYLMAASEVFNACLLYTSPSPRDMRRSRMPSSA